MLLLGNNILTLSLIVVNCKEVVTVHFISYSNYHSFLNNKKSNTEVISIKKLKDRF